MCWPILLQVGAAAIGAFAQQRAGQAQASANLYNAQIADRNAQAVVDEKKLVSDKAAIDRRRLGEQVRAQRGELYAKYGAMGLDPNFGTPADLVGDINQAYSIDRSILGRNEITDLKTLDKQQADFTDQAKMLRSGAKGALQQGNLSAAGSFLDKASTVSSRWFQPAANKNTPSGGAPGLNDYDVLRVGGG